MLRKGLFSSLAAVVAMLLMPEAAWSWGGYHAGYTHVGPGGVQHWGRTAGVGPYGGFAGGHAWGGGWGGGYRAGYGYGARYGGLDGGVGGYRYGGYGAY